MSRAAALSLADDAVVTAEGLDQLKRNFARVYEWHSKWKLDVDSKKCGIVKVNNQNVTEHEIEIGHNKVDCVEPLSLGSRYTPARQTR